MTGTVPAVSAARLSKRFGHRVAVAALDLRVERGEAFGLIGPNGAGKTTTMRMLLDLVRPTSGSVRVLGEEPRVGGAGLRRRVGYLPGELRLGSRTTGRDLVSFHARLVGAEAPLRARADVLAERLGLDLDGRVGALSKGNKQKLGLVLALMPDPELLVLDEPTSGLDPLVQQEFQRLVREAVAAGATVLLSSHVLSEVQAVAERVGLLRAGRLERLATVAELRALAPRRLRLRLPRAEATAASGLAAVPGVADLTVDAVGDELSMAARVTGSPRPLLEALHRLPVLDLVLEEPDLEDAVLTLYRRGGAS